jgi:hypothetical protein
MTESNYMKRNLAVANSYGIKAGLDMTYRRMSARNDCPQWLKDSLADLILRAEHSKVALLEYRAESPDNPHIGARDE